MPSTLLAVDDSVTMRKVLEITFASPDFRVIAVNSPDAALQKFKSDKPDLVIADTTIEPNGYELCKAIKKLSPGTPVLLLSSKQNAFDAAKAAAAQVDDHMDKPFDTQQMIDKVKKMLAGQGATAAAPAPAAAAKPAASAVTETTRSAGAPAAAKPLPAGAAAVAAATPQRAKTLIYNPPTAAAPPAAAPQRSAPPSLNQTRTGGAEAPQAAPAREPAPAKEAPAPSAAVATQVNGQMTAKLEQLGLTAGQVDAVLALSREIVERVVWEVVPTLAETMIKEELARLTK